jgi:hypothetical protein
MRREPTPQPKPVLQLRYYREDGTVVEAEVAGGLVAMKGSK